MLSTCSREVGTVHSTAEHLMQPINAQAFIYPDLLRYVREENRCVLSFFGLACDGPNEAHHEPPRSQGGTDDRLLCVCRRHHRLRHDKPNEFFAILKPPEILALQIGYIRSYLLSLLDPDGQVKRPKVKVPTKKKAEPAPKGKWQPIDQSAKRGKGSATRPLNVPRYT
jgi:hypothetical protein